MKIILGAILLLLMTSTCMSQDNVKLVAGGKKIRGEIIAEDKTSVTIITRLGERQIIKRTEIRKMRRGRPISKVIVARLKAIDQSAADQVFVVAQWASTKSSLKGDAKRLARRVLALNPEHLAARKMLGHVKGAGQWYEDAEKAERAVTKFFQNEGRKKFNNGWVLSKDFEEVQANPQDWMLVDQRWHLTSKIMTAKGFVLWNGDWVPPEEKDLVSVAESILRNSKIATHFAQIGVNKVWHYGSRKQALDIAKISVKTREWAAEIFTEPSFKERPTSYHVVLETAEQFQTFLYNNRDVHGYSRVGADRHKAILGFLAYYLTFGDLGGMLRLRRGEETRNLMVWDMGRKLCRRAWHGSMNRLPAWIPRAVSVHAEIAILGKSDVTEYNTSKYDRTNTHQLENGTHKAAHAKVLGQLNAGKTVTVRDLFGSSGTSLTNKKLTWGTVLLSYLLEQRKPQFEAYVRDAEKTMKLDARFTKHFKESFEEMQVQFEAWIRK